MSFSVVLCQQWVQHLVSWVLTTEDIVACTNKIGVFGREECNDGGRDDHPLDIWVLDSRFEDTISPHYSWIDEVPVILIRLKDLRIGPNGGRCISSPHDQEERQHGRYRSHLGAFHRKTLLPTYPAPAQTRPCPRNPKRPA